MKHSEFIELRNTYLTSARPIESFERLKGRDDLFRNLTNALESPGRHAFIYGMRGVGKTSLAHTAAFKVQSAHGTPIIVSCDNRSNFENICESIIDRGVQVNELEKDGQFKINLNIIPGIVNIEKSFKHNNAVFKGNYNLKSATGMANLLDSITNNMKMGLVVVIDEFDQVKKRECHNQFSSLIKICSDQNIKIKFIFCGISKSVEELFDAHQSVHRQITPIEVYPLKLQSCIDIIAEASQALNIAISDNFKYRIAKISDGFPAFVHLIAEKVFTETFNLSLLEISSKTYTDGLDQAIIDSIFYFRKDYEKFAHLYTKHNEHILWAIAYDKLLNVNTDGVYTNYLDIASQLRINPITRAQLSQRLSTLCKPDSILTRIRRSNFSFKEQMMRPYARLRAERVGIKLGPENPGISSASITPFF